MRLNQYLAACGLASRRRCEEWITAGRVQVNGDRGELGTQVGPADTVTVDGEVVHPERRAGVWVLHKPAGVLCASRDERGRRTVIGIARDAGLQMRLFSVGRLDLETTGLLLLTNDGALAHRLTHPSRGVEKEYEAIVAAPLPEPSLERLRRGLVLDDGPTHPCTAGQEPQPSGKTLVRLILHEGRKRQARRMLAAVGSPVLALHRVRIGNLRLGTLPAGALRPASAAEIDALEAASAQDPGSPAPATGRSGDD
jgi:pseudouridine synthase